MRGGVRVAAQDGAGIVRAQAAASHAGLGSSVEVQARPAGAAIVIDAPQAAAVEVGSRPHTPPLGPLIAWVKARGAQGLLPASRLAGRRGAASARSVARALASREQGGALDVGAPVALARAIQHAIATRGTPPHWYARRSLPALRAALDAALRQALRDGP